MDNKYADILELMNFVKSRANRLSNPVNTESEEQENPQQIHMKRIIDEARTIKNPNLLRGLNRRN